MNLSPADKPVKCLVVVLRAQPLLVLTPDCPQAEFSLETKRYSPHGDGSWTGFYDWLRDRQGHLIGVRYWPFADSPVFRDLQAQLPPSPRLATDPNHRFLEIYFSHNRDLDRDASDDQDFGHNGIFSTLDGEWAIAFSTAALSDAELASLGAATSGSTAASISLGR